MLAGALPAAGGAAVLSTLIVPWDADDEVFVAAAWTGAILAGGTMIGLGIRDLRRSAAMDRKLSASAGFGKRGATIGLSGRF